MLRDATAIVRAGTDARAMGHGLAVLQHPRSHLYGGHVAASGCPEDGPLQLCRGSRRISRPLASRSAGPHPRRAAVPCLLTSGPLAGPGYSSASGPASRWLPMPVSDVTIPPSVAWTMPADWRQPAGSS